MVFGLVEAGLLHCSVKYFPPNTLGSHIVYQEVIQMLILCWKTHCLCFPITQINDEMVHQTTVADHWVSSMEGYELLYNVMQHTVTSFEIAITHLLYDKKINCLC